jgi:hypothetical protein
MADVRLGRPRFHQSGVLCTVDRATTIFGWANGAAATQFRFASTHFQASNSSTKRARGPSEPPVSIPNSSARSPPLKFSALRASVRPAKLDSAGRN